MSATDQVPVTGRATLTEGRVVIDGLTKQYGSVAAVDDLSFTVEPGRVTGFLGPNGAGKTTTLRMLLGLVTPTSGSSTIGGRPYGALADPARTVGAGLDGSAFHPGRNGRDHLRWMAQAAGLPRQRVPEVLDLVGLTEAQGRRVGGYSLGMKQRLALAGAMLGDPRVLVLDEPANGLDPEGIAWLRTFLRHLASEGRTVLVSSHVLSEVKQTVDDAVIIARGRLVTTSPLADLGGDKGTAVTGPDVSRLHVALQAEGHTVHTTPHGLTVDLVTPAEVGAIAFRENVELHSLTTSERDLETVFLELTADRRNEVGDTSTAHPETATEEQAR